MDNYELPINAIPYKNYIIDAENERIHFYEGDKEIADIACKVLGGEDSWGFSELAHNLDSWRWKKVTLPGGERLLVNIGSITEHTDLNKNQIDKLNDKSFLAEISRAAIKKIDTEKRIAACKNFEVRDEEFSKFIDRFFVLPPNFKRSDCKGKLAKFQVSVPKSYNPELNSIHDLKNHLRLHSEYQEVSRNVFYEIDIYCDGKSYFLGFPPNAIEKVHEGETLNWGTRNKNENGGTILEGWDPYFLFKAQLNPKYPPPVR
jgi:hypothetical protein